MVGWFAPQKMKQKLLNYSLGFIAMLFASCDCVREVQAVVLDTSTGQAVEAVMVREAHGQELEIARIQTDINGHFTFRDISGGWWHCPDVVLYFEKEGYQPVKKQFRSFTEADTVFLAQAPSGR